MWVISLLSTCQEITCYCNVTCALVFFQVNPLKLISDGAVGLKTGALPPPGGLEILIDKFHSENFPDQLCSAMYCFSAVQEYNTFQASSSLLCHFTTYISCVQSTFVSQFTTCSYMYSLPQCWMGSCLSHVPSTLF